jgi:DNA-directed RNA polymerase specialized sigma24 family protein
MRQPDDFDAFYKDARERLLVQTYAMTGDLAASRRAVREAFVIGWHHWRKLSRHERPEDHVRPHAWRLAQRKHSARVWHREKDISDETRATLDALGRLSMAQRRVLVLTQLASVSMDQMAREAGLPLERAEQELQTAATAVAVALDVSPSQLRLVFEQLGASVAGRGHWPRASIVRRSGAARRRAHTVAGVLGVVGVFVASGSLVSDATGVRPSLEEEAGPARTARPSPRASAPPPLVVALPESALLTTADVQRHYPARRWSPVSTSDNSTGNGIVVPCQQERYADPRGRATLVRTLQGTSPSGDAAAATATQLTEASGSSRAAQRTFRTTAAWFAGCTDPQVQLLATRTPVSVGDEAVEFLLRRWASPVTTYVVGVTRTGDYTTTTAVRLPGSGKPRRTAGAALLGAATERLCALPRGGACAPDRPEVTDRSPLPTGKRPALVAEVDLPPVSGVRAPWVGTPPSAATTNAAATSCDDTSFTKRFQGTRITRAATRTFVVPEADLPQEFGLTETVGALPAKQAGALAAKVRKQLASCPTRELNTEVDQLVSREKGGTSIHAWRLDVELTDKRSLVVYMAFVRSGTAVAQLGFVPGPRADFAKGAFADLAERALQRLEQLPAPS